MKEKARRDEPVKVPLDFDEAMRRAVKIKPPAEGWTKYLKALTHPSKRQRRKRQA